MLRLRTACGLLGALLGACADGTLMANGDDSGHPAEETGSHDVGETPDAALDPVELPGASDPLLEPDMARDTAPELSVDLAPDLPPDVSADVPPDVAIDVPSPEEPEPEIPAVPEHSATESDSFFAWQFYPGEYGYFNVALTNTGTATWSQASGFSLRAPDGSDLFAPPIFEMGDAVVAPGERYIFRMYVEPPGALGTYSSEWQMYRNGFGFFGDVVSSSNITVAPNPHLCPAPEPPPQDRMNGNILNDMGYKKVLDSTPIVYAYGGVYCADIGYTDDRRYCPPRPPGHPETAECDQQVVGIDPDSGRSGPNWTFNGQPCLWEEVDGRCRFHGSNQFLVIVHGPGLARACGRNGCCKEIPIP